jgi:hypothetical protein
MQKVSHRVLQEIDYKKANDESQIINWFNLAK